jgi:hypothetical protein
VIQRTGNGRKRMVDTRILSIVLEIQRKEYNKNLIQRNIGNFQPKYESLVFKTPTSLQ